MKRLCGAMVVLLAASQLAHGQDRRPVGPPTGIPAAKNSGNPKCNGRTYVLIAGGSSDLVDVKERLDNVLEDPPCSVVTKNVGWVTDDSANNNYRSRDVQAAGAARIVCEVQWIRQTCPASAIVLVGYCAGARVVLLAAEQLPPGSIDRIILLAPAVSSSYDVRGALRTSRCGIYVFCSADDNILENKEWEIGSADGLHTTVAGRTTFTIARGKTAAAKDPILNGLHQYDVTKCGFAGGHFATLGYGFLRDYVVPLIPCCQCAPSTPTGPPPGGPPPHGPYPPPLPAPNGPPQNGPYPPPGPPPYGPPTGPANRPGPTPPGPSNYPGPTPPPPGNAPTPAPPHVGPAPLMPPYLPPIERMPPLPAPGPDPALPPPTGPGPILPPPSL